MGRESREQRFFSFLTFEVIFVFFFCSLLPTHALVITGKDRNDPFFFAFFLKLPLVGTIRASLSGWTSESRSRNILLH